jgi:ActR/RegA family two-component response regulator
LAQRQQVTVDQVVAAALSAQVSAAAARPSIAARAQRVNWQKVDQILARVPAKPPAPGDER